MANRIKLEPHENVVENLGMFTCKLTAGLNPKFRVHGVALVPGEKTPHPATPVTTLVLPMSPETAIQLALAISEAAIEAKIPLPRGVLVRDEKA
jgi:hypothetical protein